MAHESYAYQCLCANCQTPGNAVCANCRLVTYCSKQCQSVHWKIHRSDCKPPLRAETWQPLWATEQREPTWMVASQSEAEKIRKLTADKYFWGNVPALDVLQLKNNEGESSSKDAKLLFAASGDPRNVVKTFAALPRSYDGTLSVTMNDHDPHTMARIVIMCLLAASVGSGEEVSACILHVWTLYQAATWPLDYTDDPINGWGLAQVLSTPCGNATDDLIGKLFHHVRSHLSGFHRHLSRKKASFEFLNVNAANLTDFLPKSVFARMKVSNLSGLYYLAVGKTVSCLGPLLQRPSDNPHATLLTLFMGAVGEAERLRALCGTTNKDELRSAMESLAQYQTMGRLYQSPAVFDRMVHGALHHVTDHESLFEDYFKGFGFGWLAHRNKLRVKTRNTIIQKWPLALKLKKVDAGFDEEFDMLFGSCNWGSETYVE